MAAQTLCVLPPPPPAGCCDPPAPPPAAPLTPVNPPGQVAIAYRIGNFTTFRRAMLDRLAELEGAVPPLARPRWRENRDGDAQTMLVELWAYLADVLAFYQERIANEAFLPTATQRDSLRRLAELIGYRPLPGAGAAGQVAFTIEDGKAVELAPGFRVGSKASPGKAPAVYETEAALTALGEHSAIPLSAVAPTRQFATLSAFATIFGGGYADVADRSLAAAALYGSAGSAYLSTLSFAQAATQPTNVAASPAAIPSAAPAATPAAAASGSISPESMSLLIDDTQASEGFFLSHLSARATAYLVALDGVTRTVVLKGTSTRLAAGDRVLVVANEGVTGKEKTYLYTLDAVRADAAAGTTTVVWREDAGVVYDESTKPVRLYALRVTANVFGSAAPDWSSLPATLNNIDGRNPTAPYKDTKWDDSTNLASTVPAAGDPDTVLYLDGVYDDITASADPAQPQWAAIVAESKTLVVHVADARPVSKAAYAISAKVTRLTFGPGERLPTATFAARFPLRETVVYAGSEPLALENNLPLPEPLSGKILVLSGIFPRLRAGQTAVLRGNLLDPTTVPPSQVPSAESVIIAAAPAVDAVNGITTVTLTKPLARTYARSTTTLLANLVVVTQGETLRDEILGSGNGAPFQTYPLKKKPLTYLPSSDPEGLAAVESTLQVSVNGVLWKERPEIMQAAADDQVYVTTLDDEGQTAVTFGDGVNGARPPTGRDNIHARYRKGLGESGNVGAGGISRLIDSLPGVQKVDNPLPAGGGAEPETSDRIRVNAPASVRTFGRAVSADDYAALALSYPGVAKASATWVLRDPATLAALPQPYVRLTVALADRQRLADLPELALRLRAFLDRRRDPNVPLRIGDADPVYVDVAARVTVDDRHGRQATLDAARAALDPETGFFSLERLGFGESIHLSAVYAAIQAAPGVRDALITRLRRLPQDTDPATVRDHIFIRPTEIAAIGNDPLDTANSKGKLTLTLGAGGFVDT